MTSDQGFALCVNAADGELIFRERLPDASANGRGSRPFYASPVLANGLIYSVSRTAGTYLHEAKAAFKLVEQNKFASETSDFNGTPAVSGSDLFLRSNKFLYCIAGSPVTH